MKKLLRDLVLSASLLTALSSPVFGENENYRIHPSLGYHENTQIFHGTDEKYNPIRTGVGIEFDHNLWIFNKFKIFPFVGGISDSERDYDVGIDFKLKKIISKEKVSPFFYFGLGGIYLSEDLQEHKYKWNFNLNAGAGIEYKLSENSALTFAIDLDHISMGKKLWNTFWYGDTSADNSGNPGLNTWGFVIGWIY